MNSNHRYSWFIPLGGFIGFLSGMILAASYNVPPTWERQDYPSISQSADPVTTLIGFDYESELLFVRSKSQQTYQCHVTWPGRPTSTICIRKELIKSNFALCRPIFPTLQPPGKVISTLEVSPCQDDGPLQIDYVILSDNSIWRLIQCSGGVGESLAFVVTLVCASIGTVLGVIIGFLISRITRSRSTRKKPGIG